MPVVVTDAGNPIGESLVRLVAGTGAEVRAFASAPRLASSLREAGAKVTERPQDDPDAIRSALNDAHTVVHTPDGLFQAESDVAGVMASTERLLAAGKKGGIRRFILLSSSGADPRADNLYLRTMGEAEEAVRGAGFEHVVVRVPFPESWTARAFRVWLWWTLVPGTGRQVYSVVAVDQVARLLAAADDRAGELAGTYAVAGAESPARHLAGRFRPGRPVLRVAPGSGLARRTGLTRMALEVLAGDRLPDAPDASQRLGAPG